MIQRIRIVLADDHVMVRQGIRQFLEEAGDVEVVAEVGDGAEAVRAVEAHQPDVAVLDIRMPGVTGVEATSWGSVIAPSRAIWQTSTARWG